MNERKHITETEFEKLLKATDGQRHEARDRLLLLLMYRHGLRVSEALSLRLADIDQDAKSIYIRRLKAGLSTSHPLRADEHRALRAYLTGKTLPTNSTLFMSERGTAMTRQQVNYLCRRYGELADLPVRVHPHMLRHGCGYALANRGADTRLIQDYMGHRNIQSTVIYTATNPERFKSLW